MQTNPILVLTWKHIIALGDYRVECYFNGEIAVIRKLERWSNLAGKHIDITEKALGDDGELSRVRQLVESWHHGLRLPLSIKISEPFQQAEALEA